MIHYIEELGRNVVVTQICDWCAIHAGGERHKLAKILRQAQAGTCDICEMRGLVVAPEAWGL